MDKKEAKSLQQERIQLFRDQANFTPTKRIPHFSNAVTWKVFDAGESLSAALTDKAIMEKCVTKFLEKYYVDGIIDLGIRNQFYVTENFVPGWFYYYNEDCVGIKDHAYCTVDTLQEYIDDPIGYCWKNVLPKKFGEDWNNIPLSTWKKTFQAYMDYTKFIIHMSGVSASFGIPTTAPNNPAKGAIEFGSEVLLLNLLGLKNTSIALRRDPDKIEAFVRRWDKERIDPVIDKVNSGKGPDYKYCFDSAMIMTSHNIMNRAQFERFYWPSLSKLIKAYEDKKMNVKIFTEGKILPLADFFKDFSKGPLTFHIEQDDPLEVRKEMPNICILGGLTTDLLASASPEECVDYAKKLVDELGTGIILSEGKMLSYRNDAKSENYLAVCNFIKDYRI